MLTKTQDAPHLNHGVERLLRFPMDVLEENGIADPDLYALVVEGDCLGPDIGDANQIVLSPAAQPRRGDFVAIWFRDFKSRPVIKLLMLDLPPIRVDPQSRAMPVILCQQVNPERHYAIPMNGVSAVHKLVACVSMAAEAGWDGDGWYAYEFDDGTVLFDRITVLTKKGTVRKYPVGRWMGHDRDHPPRKVDIRVFD